MIRTITAVIAASAATAASAAPGVISTDRFGYEGTVLRYDTLADALAGTNSTQSIPVANRDLAMLVASNDNSVSDQTIMLGSWWYTQDTFFSPTEGRAGWGNTTGNTGIGYLQMFDTAAATTTSTSMEFSDFNGTHYTSFAFSMAGENAGAAQFSRFSALGNVGDGGIWHSYAMNFTATGLEGIMLSPGIIESNNQPTGVSGSITGLFEITSTSQGQEGFYVIDLSLTMTNWAWDNRNDLTPFVSANGGDSFFDGTFGDSLFRTVPAPGAVGLFALAGIATSRRRR